MKAMEQGEGQLEGESKGEHDQLKGLWQPRGGK
jgi:hypothetical protein